MITWQISFSHNNYQYNDYLLIVTVAFNKSLYTFIKYYYVNNNFCTIFDYLNNQKVLQ